MKHKKKILSTLAKARNKWHYIGEGIGVDDADLKEIEDKYSDKFRCLDEVLKLRIQRGGLTRSILCKSLREECVGRDDVAQEIEALCFNNWLQKSIE